MSYSHFDGILLGYLPHRGEYELKTYGNGIIEGRFTDRLKSITMSCPSHYYHLINKPCRFFVNQELHCDRIELTETE